MAGNPAGNERCSECGGALFPAGFDLASFHARDATAGDAPAMQAAPLEATDPLEPNAAATPSAAALIEIDEPEPDHNSIDPGGEAPRLYDEETETLTPDAFQVFGSALVDEARAQHLPVALLLVALSHGRPGQDAERTDTQVRGLADVLRRSQRGSDLLARHSSLSFALLLSGATLIQASQTARWVDMVVRQSPVGAGDATPSLAQGIAELSPGSDLLTLVRQAEEALAQAVQDGGNSVRSCAAPQATAPAPRELVIPDQRLSPELPRAVVPPVRSLKKRRRPLVRGTREVHVPVSAMKSPMETAARTVRAGVVGHGEGTAFVVSLRVDMAADGPRARIEIRRR